MGPQILVKLVCHNFVFNKHLPSTKEVIQHVLETNHRKEAVPVSDLTFSNLFVCMDHGSVGVCLCVFCVTGTNVNVRVRPRSVAALLRFWTSA